MSSDLWKEFGVHEEKPGQGGTGQIVLLDTEEKDEFGDFENADLDEQSQPHQDNVRGPDRLISSLEGRDCINVHPEASADKESHPEDDFWGEFETGAVLFDADTEPVQEGAKRATSQKATTKKALPPPPPSDLDDADFEAWEPEESADQGINKNPVVPQT